MMIHLQHHHYHVDHNSSLTDAKAECAPCENRRVDARSASERTGGHDDGGGVFVLVFVLPYFFLYQSVLSLCEIDYDDFYIVLCDDTYFK